MSKPTEIVGWAEGAGAQTSEPVNERTGGFPFRYIPPAEQINWMWRATGRWINWLKNKADNHVHDGTGADMSAPKVDLADHIEYGTYGGLIVETDTISEHVIRHNRKSAGRQTTFRTGRLQANDALLDKIMAPLSDGFSILRIARLDPGDPPVVFSVDGEIRVDEISSDNLVIKKLFGGDGHSVVTANNTTKAWGMIKSSTATIGALITGSGIVSIDRDTSGSGSHAGQWIITLAAAVPDVAKTAVFITGANIYSLVTWSSTTQLLVETYEIGVGGYKDADFSIQFLYVGA